MSVSPEELERFAADVVNSTVTEYISLAAYCFYCYNLLTTLSDEISMIWPQKWNSGKLLFLLTRYLPIFSGSLVFAYGYRSHTIMRPEQCSGLWWFNHVGGVVCGVLGELVVLLCLYALLGAKRIYLVLLVFSYMALILAVEIPATQLSIEVSRALPATQLHDEFGYACNWEGVYSAAALRGRQAATYLDLAREICVLILAVGVIFVRYRGCRGSLLETIRRDGGVYIVSVTMLRVGAIVDLVLNSSSTFGISILTFVLSSLEKYVVPTLVCRLLLHMRRTEDQAVLSVVSTIPFEPPRPSANSEHEDDETVEGGVEMGDYAGLGRLKDAEPGKPGLERTKEPV
ncbi:hypothetical protein DFP72DRAFT_1046359 [Ephemerocybe angulata]|uniref:DUF6533 domain-containing protein n=1 Tax=Ephemerocybe angulata TaxID=980116 RepID=A0A8H6HV77_9AGAR|nr:hypothetical protein DFP72DRAFT_1046359 [Tulosesus angulatus]